MTLGTGRGRKHSDQRRARPNHRRPSALRAAVVGLACLPLLLGTGTGVTDASWTSATAAGATITTAELGAVADVNCEAGGLLGSTARLTWTRPAAVPADAELTYRVSWSPKISGRADSAVVTEPEFLFPAPSGLVTLQTYTLSVEPSIGGWTGPPSSYAVSVTGLVGLDVLVTCTGAAA